MALLNEAASTTLVPTEIDTNLRRTLGLFQSILAIVREYYHTSRSGDKRGRLQSIEKFKEFKRKIAQHRAVPFVKPIFDQIDQINKEYASQFKSQRSLTKQDIQPTIARVLQAWASHNPAVIITASAPLTAYAQQHMASSRDVLRSKFNPMYIENPLFFTSSKFLEVFELDEIDQVLDIDLAKTKYAYLPLPLDKQNDFQYIGYFMLHLRDNQEPVTVTGSEVRKYLDLAYSGSKYSELVHSIEQYLSSNNKALIPKILGSINEFPEIVKLNNEAKQTIKTVYRGIGGEPSVDAIKRKELSSQVVATSTSRRTAKTFALQIGHLEGSDSRRVEDSIILTYSVGPDSILLDTTIFGGIFGEGEILIDTRTAILSDIERI